MVYGIIELINFAHGDIFMIGAFVVWIGGIMGQTGAVDNIPLLIFLIGGALLFTMPLVGFLNVSIERIVYRPVAQRATSGAADHGDRRVVHPRMSRSSSPAPVTAARRRSSRSTGRSTSSARRSPYSRSSSSSRAFP